MSIGQPPQNRIEVHRFKTSREEVRSISGSHLAAVARHIDEIARAMFHRFAE
jgi:hypothetical protein